jgi:hypothetical protein
MVKLLAGGLVFLDAFSAGLSISSYRSWGTVCCGLLVTGATTLPTLHRWAEHFFTGGTTAEGSEYTTGSA